MTPTASGATSAARRTGRRWLRSLTVILSSLALVLGLAPAAVAQVQTVGPGNARIGDFRFDVGIRGGETQTPLRPGGYVGFDIKATMLLGGLFDRRVLTTYGLTVPDGFTLRRSGGGDNFENVGNHGQGANFYGGEVTLLKRSVGRNGTRSGWLSLNIPQNISGGTYSFGVRANLETGGNWFPTANNVISIVIPAVETTTAPVTVTPTPGRAGETVTLSTRVTSNVGTSVPTGTVDFVVDGRTIRADVVNGVATATTTFSTVGNRPVRATYTPANSAQWVTSSSTGTVNIEAERTDTNLVLDPVAIIAGDTVRATAQVTPAGAPGAIEFAVDGQSRTVTVDADGRATAEFTLANPGAATVTATFRPADPERYTESSDSQTVTVGAETTTTVEVAPVISRVGEDTTLTATVAPADAAGTVTFTVDGQTLGPVEVVGGVATATHRFDTTGTFPVRATFTPADPTTHAASSGDAIARVESEATQTDLTLDPVEMTVDGQVTATAQVTPAGATGVVRFTVDGQTEEVTVENGTAEATFTLTSEGAKTVTATFLPANPERYTTSSDTAVVDVDANATTTGITLDPVISRVDEPTTLTATVTPADVPGTVVFTIDGQEQEPVTVTGGVAEIEHTFTELGQHAVSATFTPDDPTRYSTSTAQVTATVQSEATTTNVTVTPTRVVAGESVEFTARVNPSDATGTVTFTLEGVSRDVEVVDGVARATFPVVTAGEKTVTAEFTPTDTDRYLASSDTATFSSLANATTTELTVTPVSARAGQEVVLTAQVGPGDVAGTVTFVVDGQERDVEVVDGVAEFRHTFTTTGEHTVRADFTPTDTVANTPSSDTATVLVSSEATTTQVTVDPVRAVAGDEVTVTARVTPAEATGTVVFDFGDGTTSQPVTVNGGIATATHTYTEAGDYEISGEFTPTNPQRYTASEDTTNVFVTPEPVEQAETTVTLEPVTGAVAGQPVDITATVGPDGVAGEVRFTIDGRTMVVPVTNGEAVLTHTFATDGDKTIQAEFVPADREAYLGATDTATVTVAEAEPGQQATTTQVTVDPVRAVAGDEVTVTARVTPAEATGTVVFDFGDGTTSQPVTVNGGIATARHTYAEAGDYEISGEFTPANPQRYTASEDTTNVFVTPEPVEQAETTVTLEPVTGAVAGQPVDITATVGPDGVAGEVRFTIDGRTMVVPVTNGEAVLTHTFATDGDKTIQAEFVPADREAYLGATDTATVTVAPAPEEPGDPEFPPTTGSAGSIGDLFFWIPGTQGALGSNSGSLGSSQPSGSSLPTLESIGS